MPHLEIADGESLYYEYTAPGSAGKTAVFVNALTGSYQMWEAAARSFGAITASHIW